MRIICVDSGFLIALYNETDKYHSQAKEKFARYLSESANRLLIPWPILYETISSRTTENQPLMHRINKDWKKLELQKRIEYLNDLPFRQKALEECFSEISKPAFHYRAMSLVDRVIRNVLSDLSLKIDSFITFDYKHFIDVCKKFNRIML